MPWQGNPSTVSDRGLTVLVKNFLLARAGLRPGRMGRRLRARRVKPLTPFVVEGCDHR